MLSLCLDWSKQNTGVLINKTQQMYNEDETDVGETTGKAIFHIEGKTGSCDFCSAVVLLRTLFRTAP